ncbi:uncharacterized protein LOC120003567 isoform X2 [Tripterygium wilfordii]|uniref:uncharacterized protein LOC120003567 isoform X2 n=1 Tax=Tripterygium wilfordii TaxID=458696 RepID=UPI0018F832E9|nr:uncharacterized protein LOC120003567 isoform X2 [Tripterygium wilfordii]
MRSTADALLELDRVFVSKKDVTSQEVNVLLSCRSKAMKGFFGGALIGGGLAWGVGWKYSRPTRMILSGAAMYTGRSSFRKSISSSVDQILALDGSRIQKELATIIMERHWNDPSMMQLITRIFYTEKVFDDSTSDQPRLRWRYRNFFSDDVAFHQSSHDDSDSHDSSRNNAQRDFDSTSNNNSRIVSHNDGRKNDLEHKQLNMNTGPDVMEDPLDCVFGSMTAMEEIRNPSSLTTPTRHDHKRSHRRRRMHRHVLRSEHRA